MPGRLWIPCGDPFSLPGVAAETSVASRKVNARIAVGMDQAAFHAMYRQTVGPLRLYAGRVLGDQAEADEVVQEAYLRVLRHAPPAQEPQELRAYLFRITGNLIVDRWRRRKREGVGEPRERSAIDRDATLRIDMRRMFQRLRPRDRQLMWLAHVEGANHREIAAGLGLREQSIRVLLARARHKLAKLLRDGGYSPRSDRHVATR